MTKDAINGMVAGLDPYTTYMDKKESELFEESTSGEYAGIGAVIVKPKDDEYAEIAEILENSPAHKAGLSIGDKLVAVDKVELKELPNADVSSNLRERAVLPSLLNIFLCVVMVRQ